MKTKLILFLLLFSIDTVAQKVLPATELYRLKTLIDSLSFPVNPNYDEPYRLGYDDEGNVFIIRDQFKKGTNKQTTDTYITYFKLSDLDPENYQIVQLEDTENLVFYTGNTEPLITSTIIVDSVPRMQTEYGKWAMGLWREPEDKRLIRKIKDEFVRLIYLTWDGNVPEYNTDTGNMKPSIVNGEALEFASENRVAKNDKEEAIFVIVDEMPLFGNAGTLAKSEENIQKYFKGRLKADKINVAGTVYISVEVQKDGSLNNAKILVASGTILDELILNYIAEMPKWKPGSKKGEAAKVIQHIRVSNK